MVHGKATADAIELSALRQPELLPLVIALRRLGLRAFVYVRFALTTGRFSAHPNQNTTTQKGDTSNQLTMGTLLSSLDSWNFT
jgi:hypothetical protein